METWELVSRIARSENMLQDLFADPKERDRVREELPGLRKQLAERRKLEAADLRAQMRFEQDDYDMDRREYDPEVHG